MGVNEDVSSTVKPMTITRHVAMVVGPFWRMVDVTAVSPSVDRSRHSCTKKLVSSSAMPSAIPIMKTVAMSTGLPVAPSTAPTTPTGRTFTSVELAASRQSRSETKKLMKQVAAMNPMLAI